MNLENPHRRYNPLLDEWVLVSPHRSKRPWHGQQEQTGFTKRMQFAADCHLCPGARRASGEINPDYQDTFVFTNDFSALLPENNETYREDSPLFKARPEVGICRVVCFSPRHDLSIAELPVSRIEKVVETWQDEYQTLGRMKQIGYVQTFENKGKSMGCSNPHPHGQIWATSWIPNLPAQELASQERYFRLYKQCMLCDYVNMELQKKERIIFENRSFAALVPYWAVWPFEVMLLPKEHLGSLLDFTGEQKEDLAEALKRMGTRFDNLFQTSFPYSMGLHQSPTDGGEYSGQHFHIHYCPPLLRSATVKKFMVGFEMMAMPQRDITAEAAAERLRKQSEIHYMMDS
ncbi:MAG: galactose-1-phosphate uridylyltransferase [Deltaproteobacteria bacterium]|nr:MAG: galactose-1-phosphate uridylyltransferase [Deltaproteobacteria bacterium]